jgi:hypothetical protein
MSQDVDQKIVTLQRQVEAAVSETNKRHIELHSKVLEVMDEATDDPDHDSGQPTMQVGRV